MSIKRARYLRNNATDAERKLWSVLRTLRSDGYHFRRQVPIGPYYADFACHHAKMVIELDGVQHSYEQVQTYDAERDAFLMQAGYTVVQFPNTEVFNNLDGVGLAVLEHLAECPRCIRSGETACGEGSS